MVYLDQQDEDVPQYLTLSYLWGDPKVTECIYVNDLPFQATTNLVSFLRHYIKMATVSDLERPLWIDALCINQSDIQERISQIGLMGQIYRGSF